MSSMSQTQCLGGLISVVRTIYRTETQMEAYEDLLVKVAVAAIGFGVEEAL